MERFHKKSNVLNIKCALIFSTNLSEISLVVGRIQRDIIINLYGPPFKAAVILSYNYKT
jgi:hypothetical protein